MEKIDLAILAFVVTSFVIITPLTLWALQWQNRLRRVVMPENALNNLDKDFSHDSGVLSIVPPDMLGKYDKEIRSVKWFVIFLIGVGVVGGVTIYSGGRGFFFLGCMVLVVPIILLPIILHQRNRVISELALAQSIPSEGLTLKSEGFSGNIALFEGQYRYWLLQNRCATAMLNWNEIEVLRVKPSKTYSHGSTPPFYEFELKSPIENKTIPGSGSIEVVCILRKGFYKYEQQIINYIKANAGFPIELYDEIKLNGPTA